MMSPLRSPFSQRVVKGVLLYFLAEESAVGANA